LFGMTMHDLSAPPGRPKERRLGIGWRLLSYLIPVVVATGGISALIAGSDPPVGRNVLAHLVAVVLVVAVTWLYRRLIDRRSWHDLGLPLPGRAQLLSGGVGFGLGVLVQELAFRGYFFQNLAERLSTRNAAIVAGLIFAALHLLPVDDFSPFLALVVVADLTLMACFLTLTRLATGSLWLAIGFHSAWNWTMDYVFSLDTAAGPDYGNALVHTRVGGPDLLGGQYGGVELLYALTSALLLAGYWLFTRRHRLASPHDVPVA
jgi:membrane protease YdiL (CAAX protease family)